MCQMKFGPLSPSPSPKGKERCCIAKPYCRTTTSTLYHYLAFSESFYFVKLFEKCGLRFASLPFWGRFRGGRCSPDQRSGSFLKNFFTGITMCIIQEPHIYSGALFKPFYFTVPFFQPVMG
jgi:hypothetical protein